MGWWTDHVVPRVADRSLAIGFGSGLNIAHYPDSVSEALAVEPSDLAWRIASSRIEAGGMPVVRSGLDGQRLTEDDDSVDAVLSTFTMCSYLPGPAPSRPFGYCFVGRAHVSS